MTQGSSHLEHPSGHAPETVDPFPTPLNRLAELEGEDGRDGCIEVAPDEDTSAWGDWAGA